MGLYQDLSIFDIKNAEQFTAKALQTFQHQYNNVEVYHNYVSLLGIDPQHITEIEQIPFLPIQFFKTHTVISSNAQVQTTFTSSGTTGTETSKHHVSDLLLYQQSYMRGFELFYGNPSDYCILALLPSYLERTGSSLIYMVEGLIKQSGNAQSGFFLNQYAELAQLLEKLDQQGQKCLLIGVSFALLDLAEQFNFNLKNTIVMETGGMKGRRKEIVRAELHSQLCKAFGVENIHSEYGMTELLSQAYSDGKGIFRCPPWMKILTGDTTDPLSNKTSQGAGSLCIIDLANQNSCSFIQTQDVGRIFSDGSFEVQGRMDNAPIRGCNLLVY